MDLAKKDMRKRAAGIKNKNEQDYDEDLVEWDKNEIMKEINKFNKKKKLSKKDRTTAQRFINEQNEQTIIHQQQQFQMQNEINQIANQQMMMSFFM